MFELNGKYNSCKVFSETADDAAVAQLIALMNQKCTFTLRKTVIL